MLVTTEQPISDAAASQRRNGRLALSTHLLVLGGYALLTVILTYPVAFRLFSEVPGGGDAWHNIWNLWWVKQALVDRHVNPFQTDMLYYPNGVNLYFHTLTFTAGLISIPLQLLGLNLIATYNLVLLSSFVLAGYGAFLLCRYVTGSLWPSFVGGLIFTFAPYHFAHMYGHMNLVSLQWIPFYVLLLLKAVDAGEGIRDWGLGIREQEERQDLVPNPQSLIPKRRSALLYAGGAGALLAVNAYTDWLYAIFLLVFTVLLVGWRLALPSERTAFGAAGVGWKEGVVRLVVGAGVFLLLVSPLLIPSVAEAQKGYAQQSADETLIYSSDVMLAFTPSELHPLWGRAVTHRVPGLGVYLAQKGTSERVVFLGYTVLALAAYAVWRLRRDRRVLFWAFAALVTWVLTLGPILQAFGRTRIPGLGITIPMPYALLSQLPFLSIMRTPGRFTVLAMLALAVLGAIALKELLVHAGSLRAREDGGKVQWRYAALAFGVPALALFEFLSIPFPTAPPGWDIPIYSKVAVEPGRFGMLDLPLRPLGDYMAFQTVHGKPIIGGFLARRPPYPALDSTPTLQYLLDETDPAGPLEGAVAGGKGVQALRDLGVKYVVVHWGLFSTEQKKPMETKVTALLGRPPDFIYPANQASVWQLSP